MKRTDKLQKKEKVVQDNQVQQSLIMKIQYEQSLFDYASLGTDTDTVVQNGINIMTYTAKFAEKAKAKVNEIIDELFLPNNVRNNKFSNVTYSSTSLDSEIPSKIIFKDDFFIISIALPELVEKVHMLEHGFGPTVVEENSVG